MTVVLLCIALVLSLICIFFSSMPLWLGILMFPLSFLLMLLPLVVMILAAGLSHDQEKPLLRCSGLSRLCVDAIVDLLCTLGMFKTDVSGIEKLPADQRFLMVSNHRSAADPMIAAHCLKKFQLAFVSKPSNMALPILGNMAYGAGFLAIDRENDRKALKTILTAASYLKKGMCSVCIYPEGTRSRDGKLLPFHAGSFKIAQKAAVPVAVVCVSGTEKVGGNLKRLRSSKLKLDILELIDAERVQALSSTELADYSRALIQAHIASLEG